MYKFYVETFTGGGSDQGALFVAIYEDDTYISENQVFFDIAGVHTNALLHDAMEAAILDYANVQNSYGISASDIIWSVADNTPDATQGVSRTIQTGTGAVGFQPSATRDALVGYDVTIVTTATIGGSQSGTVLLEIAPTNSATPGDWVEIARFTNGQAITLALTLQSVQTIANRLSGFIPKGYYAKLRSINNSGTPTFTYNTGQEVLL